MSDGEEYDALGEEGGKKRRRATANPLQTLRHVSGWALFLGFVGAAALVIGAIALARLIPPANVCATKKLTIQGVCDNVTWSPTIGAVMCKMGTTATITVPPFTCVSLNTSSGVGSLYTVLPQAFRSDIDYGLGSSYFSHVTHNYNTTDLINENPKISFMVSWYNANGSAPAANYINVIAGAAGAPSSPVLEMGVNIFSNTQLLPNSAAGNFGPNHGITLGPYQARSAAPATLVASLAVSAVAALAFLG